MTKQKLTPIERPNGALYRPRALRSVTLGNEDELTGIVVFGTVNIAEASSIARLDIRAFNREHCSGPLDLIYAAQENTARTIWWSRKLSHFGDYNEPYYLYEEDLERGAGGVHFDVEMLEQCGCPHPYAGSPCTRAAGHSAESGHGNDRDAWLAQ
ncbi:hypothetical protein [Microbacterium arborescens]